MNNGLLNAAKAPMLADRVWPSFSMGAFAQIDLIERGMAIAQQWLSDIYGVLLEREPNNAFGDRIVRLSSSETRYTTQKIFLIYITQTCSVRCLATLVDQTRVINMWVERFGLSVSSVARFSSEALPKTGKSCKIWLNFDGKHSFFTKPIAIFRSWS